MDNELNGESVEESDEEIEAAYTVVIIQPYLFEPTMTHEEVVAHETAPW
jgi:hypothetical protein